MVDTPTELSGADDGSFSEDFLQFRRPVLDVAGVRRMAPPTRGVYIGGAKEEMEVVVETHRL